MFDISVKSKFNLKVLDNLEKLLPNALEEVLKYGQKSALDKKKGSKDQKMIQYDMKQIPNGVEGRIFTTFVHALFMEYGTGNKSDGTMPHIGHTKTFKDSGMTYWWIPPKLSKDGEWHLVYAQSAHPYMRPTAFELEDKAKKILANYLSKNLRK